MTEFKVDEKVRANGYGGIWTILMIDGGDVWCKGESGNHLTFGLGMLKKAPTFFVAGKNYKNKTWTNRTFECHYVGAVNGDKYAVGKFTGGEAFISVMIEQDFPMWTEI